MAPAPATPAGRNLVVAFDGTGNQVEDRLSNVLKLYRFLEKDDGQIVYYHPGLGTIGLQRPWSPLRQRFQTVFGLATGWGLDDQVLAAYDHLCRTWQEGDRIYLFGFSRGAYTARVLAGFIHLMGLLRPEQVNLAGSALTAYKRVNTDDKLDRAWKFRRVIGGRRVSIHFMGLWDTVGSVIVPRPDRLYWPTMQFLPYTKKNPAVRVFRQAASINERRRMFRLYSWIPDQEFRPDPFDKAKPVPQDQLNVWFAGDHSDVGGGYPESESQPAKFPLIWLAREARAQGLRLDMTMFRHLACGAPAPGPKRSDYVAPDATAPLHNSLTPVWQILEWLPKNLKWKRWPARTERRGRYLPRGEWRMIPEGANLHRSVIDRIANGGYAPPNLPKHHVTTDDLPSDDPPTDSRPRPNQRSEAMPITAQDLLKKDQAELDALFSAHEAGPIPDGEAKGTAIIAPGTTFSDEIAKMISLFAWQGKVFDAETGQLRNHILPFGLKAIVAKVYKGPSWLDGKECIVLDYSETSLVAHWVRDEIREIAPNLYLGKVYWNKTRLIDFALEF